LRLSYLPYIRRRSIPTSFAGFEMHFSVSKPSQRAMVCEVSRMRDLKCHRRGLCLRLYDLETMGTRPSSQMPSQGLIVCDGVRPIDGYVLCHVSNAIAVGYGLRSDTHGGENLKGHRRGQEPATIHPITIVLRAIAEACGLRQHLTSHLKYHRRGLLSATGFDPPSDDPGKRLKCHRRGLCLATYSHNRRL